MTQKPDSNNPTSPVEAALIVMEATPNREFHRLKRLDSLIYTDLHDKEDQALFIAECKAYLREQGILSVRESWRNDGKDELEIWASDCRGHYIEESMVLCYSKAVKIAAAVLSLTKEAQ